MVPCLILPKVIDINPKTTEVRPASYLYETSQSLAVVIANSWNSTAKSDARMTVMRIWIRGGAWKDHVFAEYNYILGLHLFANFYKIFVVYIFTYMIMIMIMIIILVYKIVSAQSLSAD